MLRKDEMAHLARLARLAPDQAQMERFGAQCTDILSYMDMLAEVDTKSVEPLYSPVDHPAPCRPDVAERRRERSEVLSNAPESNGSFFVVPRIV